MLALSCTHLDEYRCVEIDFPTLHLCLSSYVLENFFRVSVPEYPAIVLSESIKTRYVVALPIFGHASCINPWMFGFKVTRIAGNNDLLGEQVLHVFQAGIQKANTPDIAIIFNQLTPEQHSVFILAEVGESLKLAIQG